MEKYNRWQINVQKDGVRKSFVCATPGRTGQRECNKKADNWLDEGIFSRNRNVSEASSEYIENLKLTTTTGHWGQYEYYFRKWINPVIGKVKLENISEKNLQDVINNGYIKKLSKKTLKNIKGCMNAFLKFCRKAKYTSFISESVTIPNQAPVKEKRILQPAEIQKLFTCNKTLLKNKEIQDNEIYAYRFEVVTGLRPGELIGLKWSDIKNNTIYLQRAINVHKEQTEGKNRNARRSFVLTSTAIDILNKQREYQKQRGIESEFVFTSRFGEVLFEHTYYKHWVRFREYNHIETPVSLYEMRHTFVSMVKTLPEGYLKELVGHSKDMDTYGAYSHVIGNDKIITATLIQDILAGIIEAKDENSQEKKAS
jgi:integrase